MVRPDSLRQKAYESWVKNPYITAKKFCEDNKISYKSHGAYINKLLSEYRSYHKFGLPQKPLALEKRTFVWFVPRVERLPCGWSEVSNRNGMWIFHHDLGSVHWYQRSLVQLYLRGAVQLARAKELFCKAFGFLPQDQLLKYVDAPLREESRKWIFDLGAPVPRFDIRTFEASHGLRVFSDGSHPTALHFLETTPYWIGRIEQSMDNFGKLHEQFGKNLEAHLRLIRLWEKEARGFRAKSKVRRIKEQPNQRNLFEWMV